MTKARARTVARSAEHLLLVVVRRLADSIHGLARRTARFGCPAVTRIGDGYPRRSERGEWIRDLERARAEAIDLCGAAACAARLAPRTRRREHVAAQQHAFQVGRRHLVAECRGVEVAKLRERESGRGEREADVRVRELPAQAIPAGEDDLAVVERERAGRRRGARRCPRGAGVDAGGNDPEKRRRELAAAAGCGRVRSTSRAAPDAPPRARRPSPPDAGESILRASRLARAFPRAAPRRPSGALVHAARAVLAGARRAPAARPRARPAQGVW